MTTISRQKYEAKKALKKAQKDAGPLWVMHIDSKAEEWKELGYEDIAKIVKKIKRSEHDNRIKKMISRIFGEGQFRQLKYILNEREKQWVQ